VSSHSVSGWIGWEQWSEIKIWAFVVKWSTFCVHNYINITSVRRRRICFYSTIISDNIIFIWICLQQCNKLSNSAGIIIHGIGDETSGITTFKNLNFYRDLALLKLFEDLTVGQVYP